MGYQTIDVRPVSGALGAEIHGVDLREPLSGATIAEIRQAFLEYLVIFFREQVLTPKQLVDFARCFGELDPHHVLRGLDEQPEVLEIIREKTDKYIFAPGWHADVTWQKTPVLGSILYGVELPEQGGDTLFANQYLAYETLSDGMRSMLDQLYGVHSSDQAYGVDADKLTKVDLIKLDREEAVQGRAQHPVVRTHPETGRKALYVQAGYTFSLKDMTAEESEPLLDYLFDHSTRPELTCRFQWRQGSLAFWDNRCSIHCPIDDYFGKRRRTWRITLQGDQPV